MGRHHLVLLGQLRLQVEGCLLHATVLDGLHIVHLAHHAPLRVPELGVLGARGVLQALAQGADLGLGALELPLQLVHLPLRHLQAVRQPAGHAAGLPVHLDAEVPLRLMDLLRQLGAVLEPQGLCLLQRRAQARQHRLEAVLLLHPRVLLGAQGPLRVAQLCVQLLVPHLELHPELLLVLLPLLLLQRPQLLGDLVLGVQDLLKSSQRGLALHYHPLVLLPKLPGGAESCVLHAAEPLPAHLLRLLAAAQSLLLATQLLVPQLLHLLPHLLHPRLQGRQPSFLALRLLLLHCHVLLQLLLRHRGLLVLSVAELEDHVAQLLELLGRLSAQGHPRGGLPLQACAQHLQVGGRGRCHGCRAHRGLAGASALAVGERAGGHSAHHPLDLGAGGGEAGLQLLKPHVLLLVLRRQVPHQALLLLLGLLGGHSQLLELRLDLVLLPLDPVFEVLVRLLEGPEAPRQLRALLRERGLAAAL
mmetsp:Transcript_95451/g.227363  ORF Transcript_95451/g.227363 Transcript_95451/m.227363 type:complete len:474 (-) Transcript_95451:69-1490(-)